MDHRWQRFKKKKSGVCFSFKGQNLSHTSHSYSLCVQSWETFSCLCFHSSRWEKANRPCWKLQQICCLLILDQLLSISTEIRPNIKEDMDGAADTAPPKESSGEGALRETNSGDQNSDGALGFSFLLSKTPLTSQLMYTGFQRNMLFSFLKKGLHFQPNITSPGLHVLRFFPYESCPAVCFFLRAKLCFLNSVLQK